MMASIEESIGKLVAKRRLEEGEFCYVHLTSNKTVSGKKAALCLLMEDKEVYKNLMDKFKLPEETEDSFNSRVIKIVQNISFENATSKKLLESGKAKSIFELLLYLHHREFSKTRFNCIVRYPRNSSI